MNLKITTHIGDDNLNQASGCFDVYPCTEKRGSVGGLLRFRWNVAKAGQQNQQSHYILQASEAQFANHIVHSCSPM